MRFRTLVACVAALAASTAAATAQEKAPEPKPAPAPKKRSTNHIEQVVEIKNRELIAVLHEMARTAFGVSSFRSDDLGILVLGGPPEAVAEAVDAIRRFDVPRTKRALAVERNAEITGYLLLARNEGNAPVGSMPSALTPVVAQLREHLTYKHYEVLETTALRVRSEGEVSGVLPPLVPNDPGQTAYKLHLSGIRITGESGAGLLHIAKVQLNIEFGAPTGQPGSFAYRNVEIKTGVDIREGQKVVVGKTSVASGGSVILVLTADVIE